MRLSLTSTILATAITSGGLAASPLIADTTAPDRPEVEQFNIWSCKAQVGSYVFYEHSPVFGAGSGQGQAAQEFARRAAANDCDNFTNFNFNSCAQRVNCTVFRFAH